ncbi:hypothetical protein [Muricoccus radiodurans]|uniref:hypothetical protein n=1 Tax=Muricoccus radiodurans TaxID=2231721 RepID=UPI003CEE127E
MSKPIPKPKGANQWNPETGKWEKVGRRLTKGTIGEQSAGFWLGQRGFVILDGPGGSMGHAGNAPGFDGVAWNPKTQELLIYDNKSFKKGGNVASASAITKNLEGNLEKQIAHIEAGRKGLPAAALEETNKALRKMKGVLKALRGGAPWPPGCSLAISNAFGNSKGVSEALAKRGIRFLDMNKAADVVRPKLVSRLRAKAAATRFRKMAAEAELRALRKATQKGAASSAGKAVGRRAGQALGKAMPKAIGKMLLRASAKKAAGRVASLVPLVGWGFAMKDAMAGAEDIMRGHTARGMSGIGLAIGDVASDFLHLGDAVSGVGGTALSLGVQGGLMVGQIAVEMDRLEEKMEELKKEVEQLDGLPDEKKLRDYYEMDDEAIADLRKSLENPPPDTEPTEDDLPPPPDWGQDEEMLWPDSTPPRSAPAVPGRPGSPSQPAPQPPPPPPSGRWSDQPIA